MEKSTEKWMRMLLSGLFLVYLVMNGMVNRSLIIGSIVIGVVLILGWAYIWWGERQDAKELAEEKANMPAISLPPTETYVFRALGKMMKVDGLEMRLRTTEAGYNVTFLTNVGGLTRMVGKGSAKTISEALSQAEEDFEEKKKE